MESGGLEIEVPIIRLSEVTNLLGRDWSSWAQPVAQALHRIGVIVPPGEFPVYTFRGNLGCRSCHAVFEAVTQGVPVVSTLQEAHAMLAEEKAASRILHRNSLCPNCGASNVFVAVPGVLQR